MRGLLVALICLFSLTLSAKTMELGLTLSQKSGAQKNHYKLSAQMGEEFSITKDDIEAVFTAVESPMRAYGKNAKTAIKYSGKIYKLENGKKTLLATPEMISPLDEKSQFNVQVDDADLTISLNTQGLID